MDDTALTLGFGEILYLTSLDESVYSMNSRNVLISDKVRESRMAATSGLSSLYSRGLVGVSDGNARLMGGGAVVGYVLANSPFWFEIVLGTDKPQLAGYFTGFEEITLLFQPRPFGSYEVNSFEPGRVDKRLGLIAEQFVRQDEANRVLIRRCLVSGLDDVKVSAREDGFEVTGAGVPDTASSVGELAELVSARIVNLIRASIASQDRVKVEIDEDHN